jgi:WD40 repeat protein
VATLQPSIPRTTQVGASAAAELTVAYVDSVLEGDRRARLALASQAARGDALALEALFRAGVRLATERRDVGAAAAFYKVAAQGGHCAALPCGRRFALAGFSANTAEVWDAASRTRQCLLEGHGNAVCAVAGLPGGLVATGSFDATVRLWTAASGTHLATLQHGNVVHALALLPDGRLASGGAGGIRLWDLSTRTCTAEWKVDTLVMSLAALEGGRLASGCFKGLVHLWNTASGAREAALAGHAGKVQALAALPRGLLASGGDDTLVRVWSVAVRACVAVLKGHTASVYGLAALPDGRLASGSMGDDGVIRVWELRP